MIADFREDNGPAIKQVCIQFVELCRQMGLLTTASVAIDGRDAGLAFGPAPFLDSKIFQPPSLLKFLSQPPRLCSPAPTYYQIYP
jgi:hypothetical protein